MIYRTAQKTNHDITEDMPSSYAEVTLPTINGEETVEVEFKTILEDKKILKLGYCCEEIGVSYPIFLENHGEYIRINLSNRGIYELEPERFENIKEEVKRNVIITGVRVPVGISFTLDYVEII
jgi:hypothetical protein